MYGTERDTGKQRINYMLYVYKTILCICREIKTYLVPAKRRCALKIVWHFTQNIYISFTRHFYLQNSGNWKKNLCMLKKHSCIKIYANIFANIILCFWLKNVVFSTVFFQRNNYKQEREVRCSALALSFAFSAF